MSQQPQPKHGWVVPLPSGARARCGGPGMCQVCQAEWEALKKAPELPLFPPGHKAECEDAVIIAGHPDHRCTEHQG